ncbi:copper-binding protein [Ideonella sp. A 288]|uniref:copper-binding protein n=1 Tax=Ideonella sp. A 288 TaxID=1962181 RepID=UPI000B4B87E9|nr:copper-binding protein [Ideonella sp. A 288]
MKTLTTAALLAALALPALVEARHDGPSDHPPAAVAPAADTTEGEIRKIDRDARKLTIRHGEIKHLDMPAMTMVFRVKDDALLDKVKAGDKVRFVVAKSDSGYVVTDLQALE